MSQLQRFSFISTNDIWGGSEELWSQTAAKLAGKGNLVSANILGWSPVPQRVLGLRKSGVDVHVRPTSHTAWRRALHILNHQKTLQILDLENFLRQTTPDLVVISDGGSLPPIELAELCIESELAFVSIGQSNFEGWWPSDRLAARYRTALSAAVRCYFVSEANWRLVEKQIGTRLANAEILRNPFNVSFNAPPPWPPGETGELRLACVARLHPPSKGQDILLDALAGPPWDARKWRLTFYGEGPCEEGLRRLTANLGLATRVDFAGHVADVTNVWANSHALVLPSRYEGIPLALVEAMLCARPAIATRIAGQELIDEGVTGFLMEAPTVPAALCTLKGRGIGEQCCGTWAKPPRSRSANVCPRNPQPFSPKS